MPTPVPIDSGSEQSQQRGSASGQLFQQGLGFLEVGGVNALGEPAVDRCEQVTGSGALALALPQPRLAFAALFAFDLTLRQPARREAVALRFAPPAGPGQGKAPQNDRIFREPNDLALVVSSFGL
jgi:hypothetical protein